MGDWGYIISSMHHFALQTHEDGEETSIKYEKGRAEPVVVVEVEDDDESPFAELPQIFCTISTAAVASIAQDSGSLTTAHVPARQQHVPGNGPEADEFARADLVGVRVDEHCVVRLGDGERGAHFEVFLASWPPPPRAPGLLRRGGDRHSHGGSNRLMRRLGGPRRNGLAGGRP
ncbi:unnamed protein product [Miscanthus lutarioriparius]|uniref:Uncharacterized protein n=1 Tax=Miscanthus lutarioriparius TaxID=422564 RepID=A0A811NPN3_9POAL|nr:unnamed protein product [Miscanthus lutarioriparius]